VLTGDKMTERRPFWTSLVKKVGADMEKEGERRDECRGSDVHRSEVFVSDDATDVPQEGPQGGVSCTFIAGGSRWGAGAAPERDPPNPRSAGELASLSIQG